MPFRRVVKDKSSPGGDFLIYKNVFEQGKRYKKRKFRGNQADEVVTAKRYKGVFKKHTT